MIKGYELGRQHEEARDLELLAGAGHAKRAIAAAT